MPVIVAVGINLGIVPLLFVQVAYYSVFYPATILMAWFWLAIIGLLIPAYYGVYAYAWGLRGSGRVSSEDARERDARQDNLVDQRMPDAGQTFLSARMRSGIARWRVAAGWCAAAFFIAIAFLFANGWSLMEHVGRWPALWKAHNTAGAALGTALNVGDPTLWPRWLLMFGLALGTTAVWVVFDAEWFARKTTDDAYRRWAWGFARWLYTAQRGLVCRGGLLVRFRHVAEGTCGPRCFPGR